MSIHFELPVLTGQGIDAAQGDLDLRPGPVSPSKARQILAQKKPEWFKIRPPGGETYTKIKTTLRERGLSTVCEEARCPNLTECWNSGTATFMLMGDTCTRACRFCAVKTARVPPPLDPNEPQFIAQSVHALGLKYVVLTSVDRDDLPDGGALHIAQTIQAIKRLNHQIIVEALVPDFRADPEAIKTVACSGVDVYAHNIETVARLQYQVRDPRAGYLQSLVTLKAAKEIAASFNKKIYTKSAIMLGLGESWDELMQSMDDLRDYNVDLLTLGQYLRPTKDHLPVQKFYPLSEFDDLQKSALQKGFLYTASGPMVRSSYKAGEFFVEQLIKNNKNSTN